jgi:hypothetical protein
MTTEKATTPRFPSNWRIGQDFDPNDHLIQLKGRDYLNVQSRLLWFIRDQRALIAEGLGTVPYTIQTELVELDRGQGWAHFKTYVRDVLGNEATMYGSESKYDFPDFIEKASTKSLGRALAMLGYGTAFAPEIDEGERVVDAPVQQQRPASIAAQPLPAPMQRQQVARSAGAVVASDQAVPATDKQIASIRKLCVALGREEPNLDGLTLAAARDLLSQLNRDYAEARQAS